ncbi:hypothetical protein [Spirosoma koreense]
MKNYLIITVGTRDVQLRRDLIEQSDEWTVQQAFIERDGHRIEVFTSRDFPTYYTVSPRATGRQLATHLPLVFDVLELPLITPVVEQLAQEQKPVDTVLLIYTNQEKEYCEGNVKAFHYNNDTIHLTTVIELMLKQHPWLTDAEFDQYEIYERVADIDYQYEQFSARNHSLFDNVDDIKSIFLLPQGGIDQVNQAVTLQLIQAFKHKVKLYQKPDGKDPLVLKFTDKFLDDLNKQKILKHLDDYDFGLIAGLLSDEDPYKEVIDMYAKFAYYKLNLNYTSFPKGVPGEFKEKPITTETKCRDLYLSAKILYHQKDYGNYLLRMYTLLENLYRVKFDQILGDTAHFFDSVYENPNNRNSKWISLLSGYTDTKDSEGRDLLGYLQTCKVSGHSLKINNPNRYLYKHGYEFLIASGALDDSDEYRALLQKADQILSQLSNFRNKATHNLASVSIEQLSKTVGKGKLDELNVTLDQIFNITGFGIYDRIRNEIRNLL